MYYKKLWLGILESDILTMANKDQINKEKQKGKSHDLLHYSESTKFFVIHHEKLPKLNISSTITIPH